MDLKLKIWRQKDSQSRGKFVNYKLKDVSPDSSFLEMLDVLNEKLIAAGDEPVAFDHDCREGICGMCSLMINGQAHGPDRGTTTCQLHMSRFAKGMRHGAQVSQGDVIGYVGSTGLATGPHVCFRFWKNGLTSNFRVP